MHLRCYCTFSNSCPNLQQQLQGQLVSPRRRQLDVNKRRTTIYKGARRPATADVPKLSTTEHFHDTQPLIFKMQRNVISKKTRMNVIGSGLIQLNRFKKCSKTINIVNPLTGSSYVILPDCIRNKKAVINVKNDDKKCFKYAIVVVSCTVMTMLYFIFISPQKRVCNLSKIERNISNDKKQLIRSHHLKLQKLRRSTRVKVKPNYFHLEFNY
ncbi:hypothetical protein AGLY_016973 [Aphis glycines]|uniref:Uncharacterized protein n=1 Tax=Aphis glycines TaxID=307491 RepID=A0A6G0SW44_APHGL|nr:hypothetical protein AGLY_016973 [Aphis glycines]